MSIERLNPFSPVDIRLLEKNSAIALLTQIINCSEKSLVLLSEPLCRVLGLSKWIEQGITNGNVLWLSMIPPNPTVHDVAISLQYSKQAHVTRVICIGGGSSIDLGKAISALYHIVDSEVTAETARRVIKGKKYLDNKQFLDIIAVPTTAGTGSEVTKWATIWDMERMEKLSVDCTELFPKMALLVPEFTCSMPARLTLSTGLDALSHAMEAFWANARTPLSQELGLSAISGVYKHLQRAMATPDDLEARKSMCIASLMAGLAFSITRTTACHSMSYPLTMNFAIEHGFAAALTLAAVAKKNAQAVPEIVRVWDIFCGEHAFCSWLYDVSQGIQPLKLSAFGVGSTDVPYLADQSYTQGRMNNNPTILMKSDVEALLIECL